jgi:cysteine desulfurase
MNDFGRYFDANATTPPLPAVKEAFAQAWECWGNPSSTHASGRQARELLESARAQVASAVGVPAKELVFTSGGTEANTMVLFGAWASVPAEAGPFELITSPLEHSSVLDTARELERRGARVRTIAPEPAALERALAERPAHLVSFMAANNETGSISDVPGLLAVARRYGALVHVDAVQALGKIDAPFWNGADFLSLSAHKIRGPKGVGALVVRRGLKLTPLLFGGNQERKRRGGTENLPGIAGFAAAAAQLDVGAWKALAPLRDRLEARLVDALPNVHFHGQSGPRLPNTTNLRFAGVDAAVLLSALDLDGFAVSAGSACSSGSIAPSHVLRGLGLREEEAREGLRIALGPWHDEASVDSLAEAMIGHVRRILARRAPKASATSPAVTTSGTLGI